MKKKKVVVSVVLFAIGTTLGVSLQDMRVFLGFFALSVLTGFMWLFERKKPVQPLITKCKRCYSVQSASNLRCNQCGGLIAKLDVSAFTNLGNALTALSGASKAATIALNKIKTHGLPVLKPGDEVVYQRNIYALCSNKFKHMWPNKENLREGEVYIVDKLHPDGELVQIRHTYGPGFYQHRSQFVLSGNKL